MNLYVTTTEIKVFMGISSSTYDTLLGMLNKQATSVVNSLLSVSDFSLHKVTNEKPRIVREDTVHMLVLNDHPIKKIGTIDEDGTDYTQTDPYDIDGHLVELDNYILTAERKTKVDYSAGYNARGMAYVDIVDYTALSTETVTVDGNVVTEATEWDAETSNEVTATNLAAAISAISGLDAFATGVRVYVMDNTVQGTGKAISVSDAVNMTLSDSTLDNLDFPEDLRMGIFLYISDLFERRKNPKLQSYTIGSKTVQFSNKAGFEQFKTAVMPYKAIRVHVI